MNANTRLTFYLTGFFGLLAAGLVMIGAADYDPVTWTLDIHAFDIRWLASWGAGLLSTGIAAIANILGWGRKT